MRLSQLKARHVLVGTLSFAAVGPTSAATFADCSPSTTTTTTTTTTTVFGLPGPPVDPHQVVPQIISWDPPSDPTITTHRVYRDGVLIATVPMPTSSYEDDTVLPNMTGVYAVTAVTATGESPTISAPYDTHPTS